MNESNEFGKTLTYVIVAGVLAAAAFLPSRGPKAPTESQKSGVGEAFFPGLTDPSQPASIEIVRFNEKERQPTGFRVGQVDGTWVIPSHHNYPADADERLSKTAAWIINLRKDSLASSKKEHHAELSVLDPANVENADGNGTRIKLFDKEGKTLADFILGKTIEGKNNYRYVRLPDADAVYECNVGNADISTKFIDWVKRDLIETSTFNFDKITVKDYSLVEKGGGLGLEDKGEIKLARGTDSNWGVEIGELAGDEEKDTTKTGELANAIADLKIVGVREKPSWLGPDLKVRSIEGQIGAQQLAQQGFFMAKNGLYSNDGEVIVESKDGLVYTLRFGASVLGDEDDVAADKPKEEKVGPEEKKDDKIKDNRFLLLSVKFDEARFPEIEPPKDEEAKEEPKKEEKKDEANANEKKEEAKKDDPDAEAKKKEAEAKQKEDEKKRKQDEFEQKKKERDKKIEDGQAKAKRLETRYANWYYVISDESFKKIRLSKKDFVKKKEKKDEPKADAGKAEPKAESKPTEKAEPKSAPKDEPKADPKGEDKPAKKEEPKEEAKPAEPKAESKPAEPPKEAEKKDVPDKPAESKQDE